MRKAIMIVALALVVAPAGALAAQPSHPATPANSHANSHATATSTTSTSSNANANAQSAKVLFVLRGTLGSYTAANGTSNGSITITVKGVNHESATLKNMTLTFPVSSTTKVAGTVKSGDNGIVKIRAAKNAAAATLQAATASQVIDQGSTTTSGTGSNA